MNVKFKTVALFAVLSLAATSCQKEDTSDVLSGVPVSEASTVFTMQYSINGVLHQITLHGESERMSFIYWMLDLARMGFEVRFSKDSLGEQSSVAKGVETFSTDDRVAAYHWADKMALEGYTVVVTFDENTRMYNCVAWN